MRKRLAMALASGKDGLIQEAKSRWPQAWSDLQGQPEGQGGFERERRDSNRQGGESAESGPMLPECVITAGGARMAYFPTTASQHEYANDSRIVSLACPLIALRAIAAMLRAGAGSDLRPRSDHDA